MASSLEVLEVDENLYDLSQVLGAQSLYKRLADSLCQELIQGLQLFMLEDFQPKWFGLPTLLSVSSMTLGCWKWSSAVEKK